MPNVCGVLLFLKKYLSLKSSLSLAGKFQNLAIKLFLEIFFLNHMISKLKKFSPELIPKMPWKNINKFESI